MNNESFITFDIFKQFPEIVCSFSTRIGGKSEGIFASQNMGYKTKDDLQLVKKNRENFFNNLCINENHLAIPNQIHSANAKIISCPGIFEKTDALITSKKGLILSVQTADCFPVFVYSPGERVVAVIHAGWRGTISGILENVFHLLTSKFSINPMDIFAAIGPGIQKECFEAGEDVYTRFPENYLSGHTELKKRFIDLGQFIIDSLIKFGVNKDNFFIDYTCTKCAINKYYSYRRDGENSGRMLGVIGIR